MTAEIVYAAACFIIIGSLAAFLLITIGIEAVASWLSARDARMDRAKRRSAE